jgi:hypothetical protein
MSRKHFSGIGMATGTGTGITEGEVAVEAGIDLNRTGIEVGIKIIIAEV